jgi:pimeloyl-ACP methyl ester carboxylesterase
LASLEETTMTIPASNGGKIYILVHGGAHGAWAFGKLAPLLAQEGHRVIAQDLPGHGLHARFPASYHERPLDPEKFAVEPSQIAGLTLRDYADQVTGTISRIARRLPGRQPILVGHSMAGLILNRVGETLPELIGRLVYLSAWMTGSGKSFNDYTASPQMATSKIPSILVGNPASTGALRFDFRPPDPTSRALVKDTFAADVDDEDWNAVANLLTPDTPAGPMAEATTLTASRWGAIPRTYISCTADQALPLAAQQRFIGEADRFTPHNPTDVRELASSHSPFMSQPEQLARILLDL